jgi:drug/metabolite transporter (DMT)-like permease
LGVLWLHRVARRSGGGPARSSRYLRISARQGVPGAVTHQREEMTVSVPAAYVGVILIWATTPLAIQWSGDGVGFLFGAGARMVIGVSVCLLLLALLRRPLRLTPAALRTYVAGGLGIWGAMSCVYWAAQFIPSGLISVVFGLSPVATGAMAALWLGERALTPVRLTGIGAGIAGLGVIFLPHSGGVLGEQALLGVAGVLTSMLIHGASSVWVKRIGARVSALETTTGALLVAVPLFVATWALSDGRWPTVMPVHVLGAIVYLGLAGSVLGFILYYHVLRHLAASRVALIPLVTPVLALALGHVLNDEPLSPRVLAGSALVLSGLAFWQWGDALISMLRRRLVVTG